MKYEPLIPDRYYHIFNRGNNRENIFIEERNYDYFLLLIQKYITPIAEIYAYCLLKNHFHLLIKTKPKKDEKALSKAFSNLFNAYAKAINKAQNRTGSLFQDRFKRIMIKDENYFKNVLLYIHLNPEHHNFIEDFSKYRHSSYNCVISENKGMIEKEKIIRIFDNRENFIRVHFNHRNSAPDIDLTGLGDL